MCTVKTLNRKLDTLAELKAAAKDLDGRIKALEDFIKAEIGDAETLDTGRYTVRYTRYTSSRFDSKAFSAAHPRLAREYTRETESRRFSWSVN